MVVVRVVADGAQDVELLEAADPMLQARGARHGPRPGERLRVPLVRVEARAIRPVGHAQVRQRVELRDSPRLRAGGEEGIGEVDDGRHVVAVSYTHLTLPTI